MDKLINQLATNNQSNVTYYTSKNIAFYDYKTPFQSKHYLRMNLKSHFAFEKDVDTNKIFNRNHSNYKIGDRFATT